MQRRGKDDGKIMWSQKQNGAEDERAGDWKRDRKQRREIVQDQSGRRQRDEEQRSGTCRRSEGQVADCRTSDEAVYFFLVFLPFPLRPFLLPDPFLE